MRNSSPIRSLFAVLLLFHGCADSGFSDSGFNRAESSRESSAREEDAPAAAGAAASERENTKPWVESVRVHVATPANVPLERTPTGELRGRVVDAEGEPALPGTEVALMDPGWIGEWFTCTPRGSRAIRAKTRTDEKGDYRFDKLEPGRYRVLVKGVGFATFAREVRVREGKVTSLRAHSLVEGASLYGRVFDVDGNLLVGALVQCAAQDASTLWAGQRTHTDEAGRFRLEHVPPGDYKLYAQGRSTPDSSPWAGVADMRNSEIQVQLEDRQVYEYDLDLSRE